MAKSSVASKLLEEDDNFEMYILQFEEKNWENYFIDKINLGATIKEMYSGYSGNLKDLYDKIPIVYNKLGIVIRGPTYASAGTYKEYINNHDLVIGHVIYLNGIRSVKDGKYPAIIKAKYGLFDNKTKIMVRDCSNKKLEDLVKDIDYIDTPTKFDNFMVDFKEDYTNDMFKIIGSEVY